MLRTLSHSPLQHQRRPGVVLLAVLVVIVLLSLAAFNYLDLMTAEYKASDNYHKNAQCRAFADSGVHYAMAVLSSQDSLTNQLNGNPYDNAQVFKNHTVTLGSDKRQGFFTLVAPLNPNLGATGTCQFGVIDEGSKLNINAVMKLDPSGNNLYQMLFKLPNMTADIANSIVDWVDPDSTPRQGGAESDYYNGLSPPYNCKNGPLDSLEELLLVKGVTPQFLFGSDLNRNGYQDANEVDDGLAGTSGFDRGWSAFLTLYSREQNVDANGLPLTNLNNGPPTIDLQTMYDTLATNLSDDLAKFIILYRQYGAYTPTPAPTQAPGTPPRPAAPPPAPGTLASLTLNYATPGSKKIASLFDLVSAKVKAPGPPQANGKPGTDKLYASPLSDPNQQATLLPKLFQTTTVFAATEIPAHINVNTASQPILTALQGVTSSGGTSLTAADITAIVGAQPQYSGSSDAPDPMYQTPAWLITQAKIDPAKLSPLEKYITTRTQVYRVQSIGYFDQSKGPVARVEAVIDTNSGQPRILSWRDMGDFGKVRPPQ